MAKLDDLDKSKVYRRSTWGSKRIAVFYDDSEWKFVFLGSDIHKKSYAEPLGNQNKIANNYIECNIIVPKEFYKMPKLDLKDIYG